MELKRLDDQLRKLEEVSKTNAVELPEDFARLNAERDALQRKIYASLSPWDRIQVARHPRRPQTLDYIEKICEDFIELHGDRFFADDRAIVVGLGTIAGHRMMLVGQHKGRDVHEGSRCNFGYSQPEGYRKALGKMQVAEKYRLPVVCLIDTKGAAPTVGAEERGQSRAIAYNLQVMSGLKTPVLCMVIGEGGSGGALGIGVGDRLLIQEYAYFSVISPEGCASILWKDPARKADAASALKMTAPDLKELGVVDGIIPEPVGGAHRDPAQAATLLKAAIDENLRDLKSIPIPRLLRQRYQRIRALGRHAE